MGARRYHTIADLKYELTPELLQPDVVTPETDLNHLYECCYMTVFETMPRDNIHKPGAIAKLKETAEEANSSLKMVMLANMAAHSASSPDRPFYASMLLGSAAVRRTEAWRSACYTKYGVFDYDSLLNMIGCDKNIKSSVERRMLNSEITAGAWLVGHYSRSTEPFGEAFYRVNESRLDPCWLAIEPSYFGARSSELVSKELNNHRYSVAKLHGELKRSKKEARVMFRLRESIAPRAVSRVLNDLGYAPSAFHTKLDVVVDMCEFWGKLGRAIHNIKLHDYATGLITTFR